MTILIAQNDQTSAVIPDWVTDLQSFRRWACSDEHPSTGSYSHLNGALWADSSIERFGHNRVKTNITIVLGTLAKSAGNGVFISDRMLLTHVAAEVSTEPDAMFLLYETLRSGRAALEQGINSLEVVGTPDMVLEVVSPTSGRKDKIILKKLYHQAGIPEYWLVDPRGKSLLFEILVWTAQGYSSAPSDDGWQHSPMFGRAFRIDSNPDSLGYPKYDLEVK